MARKEITTPLDLKNMDNHNYNYDELYSLIDETDRRISEDMWEEIKDANTMKMLKPVQTAADLPDLASLLPSEEADKSLITVIDEQRVYGFVKGEWQPFSEIDLDPFEPFKDELAAIVAAYEEQIQNITTEVQNTKTSAIDSIQSTQSQSESNINQTEQSAIDSINQTQAEAESNIGAIRDEMTTQASDLTALFNDSMDKLTSKQDTALAEVDSAKQAAITALEDFNNTDTTEWQKYKLTNDDGTVPFTKLENDEGLLHELRAGSYYVAETPIDIASSTAGFITVEEKAGGSVRRIEFRPYDSNQLFIKRFYETWGDWRPAEGTKVELFVGSAKDTGGIINLNTSYENFTELKVLVNRTGGNEIFNFDAETDEAISINHSNVFNSSSGHSLNEMRISRNAPTELEILSQNYSDSTGTSNDDSGITILKIWGVT